MTIPQYHYWGGGGVIKRRVGNITIKELKEKSGEGLKRSKMSNWEGNLEQD